LNITVWYGEGFKLLWSKNEFFLNFRNNIISGLKANWEEIHHQYQGLSVVTDTAPKKNRKERMEAEMNQLEKDIDLLEKHSNIYIANTGMAY